MINETVKVLPAQHATLDDADGLQGMTSAQQAFARYVFSGMTATEAYRRAYPEERDNPNVGQMAHKLLHSPKVNSKLVTLRLRAEGQTTLAPLLNKEWIINGIKGLAENEDVKPNTRLAAFIALGKIPSIGLFKEDTTPAAPRSQEEIDEQLASMIRGMVSTIDGNARDVTPPKPAGNKPPGTPPDASSRKRKPKE